MVLRKHTFQQIKNQQAIDACFSVVTLCPHSLA
jgi:hypothetical protein